MSVTQLHAGIASNVIPARAEANVNYRYAPDRAPDDAEARIQELFPGCEIVSHSPAAHVAAESELVQLLRAAGGFELQSKQAWTNVADFAARGLDAVNLGPGGTRYAHAADERVEIAELERTFAALQRFLAGTV
jgi:succinyl-diaminopimelate desuccinylase